MTRDERKIKTELTRRLNKLPYHEAMAIIRHAQFKLIRGGRWDEKKDGRGPQTPGRRRTRHG